MWVYGLKLKILPQTVSFGKVSNPPIKRKLVAFEVKII